MYSGREKIALPLSGGPTGVAVCEKLAGVAAPASCHAWCEENDVKSGRFAHFATWSFTWSATWKMNRSLPSGRAKSHSRTSGLAPLQDSLSSRNASVADHLQRKDDTHFVDRNRLAHLLEEEECALCVTMPYSMMMPMPKSRCDGSGE